MEEEKETRRSSSPDSGKKGVSSKSAMNFALARLARRAHSQGELLAKMERAGYLPSQITATLAKLKDWRYLDDRGFAVAFARSAAERKRWGPARIARALRERGVSEQDTEEALADAFPDGESRVLEEALARFRRNARRSGDAEKDKARAYRHLLTRGFGPGAIFRALDNEKRNEENETS
jgi:regulatory protein